MKHTFTIVVSAFLSGALFATGLVLSGMTRPSKVLGFLDFFGAWDPSLVWVMVGAIAVNATATWRVVRRSAPLFQPGFSLPPVIRSPWWTQINGRLLVGAALFGVGWGLSGYCPGPALVATASGLGSQAAAIAPVFVLAMTAGMLLFSAYAKWRHW
jgi:uncharacterized protein